MSTPATAEPPVAAPGTPGSATTPPVTPTAKSMVAAAFNEPAPTQPDKPSMPAKAAPKQAEPKVEPKADPAPKTPEAKVEPAKADTAKPATPATPELPEDALQIPANASPEAVKNFMGYKEKMKAILSKEREDRVKAEKAAADLQAQIAIRTNASPAEAAETERLKTEHQKAMDRLAILDLKNHPDFTRQFVEPKQKALAAASEVLEYNNKTGIELASLLAKPMKDFNAAVSEFTKDMNTADAATVATSLREARSLHAAEQSALAKSTELASQLKTKAAMEQKRAFDTVATEVVSSLKKIDVTDSMDAEEKQAAVAYNQRVESLRASAEKRAFGPVTERDVARMAFEGEQLALMREHVIPGLERRFAAQNRMIADLTAQLEAVKGTRSAGTPAGDAGTQPAPKSRSEMLKAAFPGERLR